MSVTDTRKPCNLNTAYMFSAFLGKVKPPEKGALVKVTESPEKPPYYLVLSSHTVMNPRLPGDFPRFQISGANVSESFSPVIHLTKEYFSDVHGNVVVAGGENRCMTITILAQDVFESMKQVNDTIATLPGGCALLVREYFWNPEDLLGVFFKQTH